MSKTLDDLIAAAGSDTVSLNVGSDILREAADKRTAAKREQAVVAVTGLLETFDTQLQANVQTLRNFRETEAAQAAKVKKMDRAYRYFAATGNPLPFYKESGYANAANQFMTKLGAKTPPQDDDAWKVPADFAAS